jgi:hypothetical protein
MSYCWIHLLVRHCATAARDASSMRGMGEAPVWKSERSWIRRPPAWRRWWRRRSEESSTRRPRTRDQFSPPGVRGQFSPLGPRKLKPGQVSLGRALPNGYASLPRVAFPGNGLENRPKLCCQRRPKCLSALLGSVGSTNLSSSIFN